MRRLLFPLLMQGLFGAEPGLAQVPDPTRPSGHDVGSGVQTVIMRPGGKSAAVVYGEYVVVGDRIGDRRVMNITEREVTLESDRGIEVLKVMPSVEKVSKPKNSNGTESSVPASHSQSGKGLATQ
jgi:hypothetical protein